MDLGAFSISLAVKDLEASRTFYEKFGFRVFAGDAAQNWLVQTYERMGVTVRKERYGTWRGWRRGRSHIDLMQPRSRTLEGTMLAWSPGTGGRPVRAPVIALPEVADSNAFAAWLPQARGKFAVARAHATAGEVEKLAARLLDDAETGDAQAGIDAQDFHSSSAAVV